MLGMTSKPIKNIQKKHRNQSITMLLELVAEAGGFEPPVRLPVRQFSKLLVSATHPNFQM